MAKAITMKGIVRSQSKLAVEDGCAEDLINLRFKDGSWRTSGDGMLVYTTDGVYSQLYIHTCSSYHHLLGVKEVSGINYLYWFADINDDGVTVETKNTPLQICKVSGCIYINQTGHLLTIIDEEDNFEYAVFKLGDRVYKTLNVDTNGKQGDRSLFPFGNVHLNLNIGSQLFVSISERPVDSNYNINHNNGFYDSEIISTFGKATDANKFTGCFFALVAIKLYDGSYVYASNPIYLSPCENIIPFDGESKKVYGTGGNEIVVSGYRVGYYDLQGVEDIYTYATFKYGEQGERYDQYRTKVAPVLRCGAFVGREDWRTSVLGSDLILSIENDDVLLNNKDIFSSVCIFITQQVPYYDLSMDGSDGLKDRIASLYPDDPCSHSVVYMARMNDRQKIKTTIENGPFFLLKEIDVNSIQTANNNIVDLSSVQYSNILRNITLQDRLDYESLTRKTFLPKYIYSYNGKMHVANYKSVQFHGFPIDCYTIQNRSLKYQLGSTYEGLQNLIDNNTSYYQYAIDKIIYKTNASQNPPSGTTEVEIPSEFRTKNVPLVIINSYINTGEDQPQIVSRFIETPTTGDITIHSLNPILSFPDSRVKEIKIYIYKSKIEYPSGDVTYNYGVIDIAPTVHLYMDMSYYLPLSLKPWLLMSQSMPVQSFYNIEAIKLLTNERYQFEQFPNGLKVSKTNNPFFFPVEQTYQVGNGAIIAMCSNAIAVGTGQTGAAPLYVFCTDGIYAMYVDQTGEMAYTNARVIARDVCNNAKSVTPIDTGVVFTTDRGLMSIAGNEVQEIGQPAEGDVQQYNAPNWAVPQNIGKNMLTKVAELPNTIVDGVDFLQFLTGAIVNYNHNERELMISNPTKQNGVRVYNYTYVLDRYGNWGRRSYGADEYVNNFPTSYRFDNGSLYKVDAEDNQLEGKSEAPNSFLYLSNAIKLDTLDFKQMHRFVLRGKFDTNLDSTTQKTLGCYVLGSYDGKKYAIIGANEKKGAFTDIGCLVERLDVKYIRIALAGHLTGDSRIDYIEIDGNQSNLSTKIR